MRAGLEPLALETSILVAFFPRRGRVTRKAFTLVDSTFDGGFTCISAVNVAEIGYVLERVIENKEFAL